MTACPFGYDADAMAGALSPESSEDARALREHARACDACARALRALAFVRGTWRDAIDRDERFVRAASERRLTSRLPRASAAWRRVLPALAVAAAAAGVAIAWGERPAERTTSAPVEPPPPHAIVAPPLPAAAPAPEASSGRVLIVMRPCAGCGPHGRLEAGERLDGAPIDVPRGAILTLNWGIDASTVDATSGVDVVGPARVRAVDEDARAVLVLDRGSARVRTAEPRAVRTADARTLGGAAAWTVRADSGRSYVAVERGAVDVRSPEDDRTITAGHSLAVRARGVAADAPASPPAPPPASPPAPHADGDASPPSTLLPPPSPSPVAELRDATRALRGGDRAGALATLRALSASNLDPSVRDRARFALAEVALADHDVEGARAILTALVDDAEPALAGDAVFLLARSMMPRDRAELIGRYLATHRPSPYREQAQLERAQALLEAGDRDGARELVRALRAEPDLPPIVQAGVGRLERTLGALF